MILGQSAATAAALAIDDDVPVQKAGLRESFASACWPTSKCWNRHEVVVHSTQKTGPLTRVKRPSVLQSGFRITDVERLLVRLRLIVRLSSLVDSGR